MADEPVASPEGQPADQQVPVRMIQPQPLPEIVHMQPWTDPAGASGAVVIISTLNGQDIHFWDHELCLTVASNLKKTAQSGGGIIRPQAPGLVLPPGVTPL